MRTGCFLVFLVLNVVGFSQAKMQVDFEKHDFGQLILGTPLRYEFYVTNSGNEPLILQRVSTGDGGSMAEFTREPILPGEKGWIRFIYDTKRIGSFSRTVYIQANSVNSKTVNLKGEVIFKPMEINVSKKTIDVGTIWYDSFAEFSFEVSSKGPEPIHFTANRYAYSEGDLYSLEVTCLDSVTQDYKRGFQFRVSGKLINVYGNAGNFDHRMLFNYNSHDSLIIHLKGTFRSKVPVTTHRDFFFKTGSTLYTYEKDCLKSIQYFSNDQLNESYFYEGTNCVKAYRKDYSDPTKMVEVKLLR